MKSLAGLVPASPHKETSCDRVLSPLLGDRAINARRCFFSLLLFGFNLEIQLQKNSIV